jgi:sn-glycerol 3-phosphate transport system ATP-binding protein
LGVRDISLADPARRLRGASGPLGLRQVHDATPDRGAGDPDSGTIRIDGRDVTAAPASGRGLSMVFQSYALFPHLDVAENVLFGLKVRRVPKAEQRAKLRQALEMTGLTGLESRKPGVLSGGQRQRVALARAIVAGHPLCLMDEPLSNLDAKLRHSVRRDIKKLQRDLGMTVIYVTHDQTEAMSMADIVVLMKDGEIEQAGRPAELYERPASTFVAGLRRQPADGAARCGASAGCGAHGRGPSRSSASGPSIWYWPNPAPAGCGSSSRHCEYMGSETFLSFEAVGTTGLTVRLPGEVRKSVGEAAELTFDAAHLHVFDKSTGYRMDPSIPEAAHSGRSFQTQGRR